jgi:hypothetical protein
MARQRVPSSDEERRERLKAKLDQMLAESKRLRSNVSSAIESAGRESGGFRSSSKRAA